MSLEHCEACQFCRSPKMLQNNFLPAKIGRERASERYILSMYLSAHKSTEFRVSDPSSPLASVHPRTSVLSIRMYVSTSDNNIDSKIKRARTFERSGGRRPRPAAGSSPGPTGARSGRRGGRPACGGFRKRSEKTLSPQC